MATKLERLTDLAAPVVAGLGYELWGIEFIAQGRHTVLRVFIEAESGIDVDDCAKVSRQFGGVLDVEDPISGEFTLEVSSPGMDRPLFTLKHYERFTGHRVELRLRAPFEGRRKFRGLIKGIEEDDVIIEVDDQEYLFQIDSIDKANIVPQF